MNMPNRLMAASYQLSKVNKFIVKKSSPIYILLEIPNETAALPTA
jgi:hypothetical protein